MREQSLVPHKKLKFPYVITHYGNVSIMPSVIISPFANLPNLNGSAGQNWRWGRNSVTETDKDGNQYQVYKNTYNYGTNASLSTEIPLFTGFELPNQYALAKLNFKAAIADLEI